VIGNPPYGALLGDADEGYLRAGFETATRDLDTYTLFMEKGLKVCKPRGWAAMIVPTGWYSGPKFVALRRFVSRVSDPKTFVNLPYDVFAAWVDTTVFVSEKRGKPVQWPRREGCKVVLKTFPKRHKITSIAEFEEATQEAQLTDWFAGIRDEFLTYAHTAVSRILAKIESVGKPLSVYADVQRGVTPFKPTNTREHKNRFQLSMELCGATTSTMAQGGSSDLIIRWQNRSLKATSKAHEFC